jgi:hypothetical protein
VGLEHQHRRALVLRLDVGIALRVVAGSLRSPDPVYGLPCGAAVWASDYAVLPEAGLYKPIWKYDAPTVARDLGAHLAYGAATGTAFWLLTRLAVALTPRG